MGIVRLLLGMVLFGGGCLLGCDGSAVAPTDAAAPADAAAPIAAAEAATAAPNGKVVEGYFPTQELARSARRSAGHEWRSTMAS
jgi:hypothetical protein